VITSANTAALQFNSGAAPVTSFWTDGGCRFFISYDPQTGVTLQSLPFYTSEWGMTGPTDVLSAAGIKAADKPKCIHWIENISGLGILMMGTDKGVMTLE